MTSVQMPAEAKDDVRGENENLVTARDLTKRYGTRVTAVDKVNLAVRRGEVYGFLGPNGAGKTTTLRMLLGLIRPTSGAVQVLGHAPGDPRGLAGLGALVESPAFYPYLSGRDNLAVMARYAGLPIGRIDHALAQVDLADRAGDRFKTYSLGMKQRLGVATALLKDPELLILDEPTNGLDPAGMADMRALIRALGESGRTVLLSSHLLGEVQQICDRVGVISRGRIIAESTVEELRGRGMLLVSARPVEKALARMERMFGAGRVQAVEDGLHLDVAAEDAPRVARELVEAGVEVHELRRVERTLEEVFFELTSDEGEGDDG